MQSSLKKKSPVKGEVKENKTEKSYVMGECVEIKAEKSHAGETKALKSEKTEIGDFGIDGDKKARRKKLMSLRAVLSAAERELFAERLTEGLCSLDVFKEADAVLSFFPLKNETDVRAVNDTVLREGKLLALPRCQEGSREMEFYTVKSLDETERGSYGIFEPKKTAPVFNPECGKNVICLVPALSYDREGFRLGYGGGYYDRYLEKHKILTVGVLYSPFFSEELPRGEHDKAVDILVTDDGVYKFGKKEN